jgi:hypothetical protein
LPLDAHNTDNLALSLGVLTVANEFVQDESNGLTEKMTVALQEMNVRTQIQSDGSASLLSNQSLRMSLHRLVDLTTAPDSVAVFTVRVEVPEMLLSLNSSQYAFLLRLALQVLGIVKRFQRLVKQLQRTAAATMSINDPTAIIPLNNVAVANDKKSSEAKHRPKDKQPEKPALLPKRPQLSFDAVFNGLRLSLRRQMLPAARFGSSNSVDQTVVSASASPSNSRSSTVKQEWLDLVELIVGHGSAAMKLDARGNLSLRCMLSFITLADARSFCDWIESRQTAQIAPIFRRVLHLGRYISNRTKKNKIK